MNNDEVEVGLVTDGQTALPEAIRRVNSPSLLEGLLLLGGFSQSLVLP